MSRKPLITKLCPYCTGEFTTTRRNKVYCDLLCQYRAKGERQFAKPGRLEYMRIYQRARRIRMGGTPRLNRRVYA